MARWKVTLTGYIDVQPGHVAKHLQENLGPDSIAALAAYPSDARRREELRTHEQRLVEKRTLMASEALDPGPGEKKLTVEFARVEGTEEGTDARQDA